MTAPQEGGLPREVVTAIRNARLWAPQQPRRVRVLLCRGVRVLLCRGVRVQVLDLNIDLSALPRQAADLMPKRVLGPRWYQTTEQRQQRVCAGRTLISLDEWRQRCDQREGEL
jgi:hypothetical protein